MVNDLSSLEKLIEQHRVFVRADGSYGRTFTHRHRKAGKYPYPKISSYLFTDLEDLQDYYRSIRLLSREWFLPSYVIEMVLIRSFPGAVEKEGMFTVINVANIVDIKAFEISKLFRRWVDKIPQFEVLYQKRRKREHLDGLDEDDNG